MIFQHILHVGSCIFALCALSALTGCGGGGGGDGGGTTTTTEPDTEAPVVTLGTMTVRGSTDVDSSVSINGIAEEDGEVDTDFTVIIDHADTDDQAFTIEAENTDGVTSVVTYEVRLD